ncbi:MAG TPA: 3'-5' exonuclease [Candidatus Elarobacter sp.]|nr:3'-5' exonuclease [Candidatus Elarobacter sp.]
MRGAAGSGKTTSALLRLRYLSNAWLARSERLGLDYPVKILVLTYNRTLKGYIEELARETIEEVDGLQLTISTFGKWSKRLTLTGEILDEQVRREKVAEFGAALRLDRNFLCEEVDYALGRFLPEDLEEYLTARRVGRGPFPRVNRRRLMDEVILPYMAWKSDEGLPDWNDIAVELSRQRLGRGYDVVVADEVQDFSANQLRAVQRQMADVNFSVTFVLDQVQQIYARGFTWQEVGLQITARDTVRLTQNHRNTVEIAQFARSILRDIDVSEEGTIPDFSRCITSGRKPIVVRGKFQSQLDFAINYIANNVDGENESVAFLHPKGWFNFVKDGLSAAGLGWVEITRESEWPQGDEYIALSTLHSAKGLEFDHVFLLGLNEQVTREHGDEEGDTQLETLRKLFAMAVGRAKKSVIVGYKPGEESVLIQYIDPATYEEVNA